MSDQSNSSDQDVTLDRTLTLRAVVLFGLAYMTPLIVLGTFGVLAKTSNGTVPTAYLLTTAAMLFTAYSYGMMARAYPVSGSAYTYVRQGIDSRIGFMVGWAVLLDYFFLPMVIWLIGVAYLTTRFPDVPRWIFLLGFIGITTALNVWGIKMAARVNSILMAFQLLVITFFVGLSIHHLFDTGGADALVGMGPFFNDQTTLSSIAAGAALAAYSFLGFDAVTTMTEETLNPKRNIPRAIMLTALIGGAIYVIVGYFTQLVHPGGQFQNTDSAALSIAHTIGGDLFGAFFLAGLVLAQFTSGIASQASASRLLYAMGRDEALPPKLFGRLSARFHTPWLNVILTGVVGCIALFLDVQSATSFINFGAFTAFTMVNVSVIFMYYKDTKDMRSIGVFKGVLVPGVGTLVNLWLLTSLDVNALVLGLIWLALGLAQLTYLTRLFRRPPPEMAMDEDDDGSDDERAAEGA